MSKVNVKPGDQVKVNDVLAVIEAMKMETSVVARMDGTIDDSTKIYSMAGAEDRKPSMSIDDMHRIVRAAGYRAVERDTFYNEI